MPNRLAFFRQAIPPHPDPPPQGGREAFHHIVSSLFRIQQRQARLACGRRNPRCLKHPCVSIRPRGVRWRSRSAEKRLDGFLDGVALFGKPGGNGFDAYRAALVMIGDVAQIAAVGGIQPERIDFEALQRAIGQRFIDTVLSRRMGKIAHAAKQANRDARRAARAAGDFSEPSG